MGVAAQVADRDSQSWKAGPSLELNELLKRYRNGKVAEDELLRLLRLDHLEMLEGRFAYDLARDARAGFPEAILALRKTPGDIAKILGTVLRKRDRIFVTRLDAQKMKRVRTLARREGLSEEKYDLAYHESSGLLVAKSAFVEGYRSEAAKSAEG